MFDFLVVAYLFLGGTGAATIMISCLIDLVFTKEDFGVEASTSVDSVSPSVRMVWFGFLLGFLFLLVGVFCLLLDLGRIDRFLTLFLNPTFSWLSFGSYALLLLLICAAGLALARFMYLPSLKRSFIIVVEILAIVIAVAVIVYTGMLLQSFEAVAFWNTAFVPILFSLSSVSSGFALLFLVAFFSQGDCPYQKLLRLMTTIDVAIIAVEMITTLLFMSFALLSSNATEVVSAKQLFFEEGALAWWCGFVVLGQLVPLVLGVIAKASRKNELLLSACAALAIMIGALVLRWGIVDAGIHHPLQLEPVPLVLEEGMARPSQSGYYIQDYLIEKA